MIQTSETRNHTAKFKIRDYKIAKFPRDYVNTVKLLICLKDFENA